MQAKTRKSSASNSSTQISSASKEKEESGARRGSADNSRRESTAAGRKGRRDSASKNTRESSKDSRNSAERRGSTAEGREGSKNSRRSSSHSGSRRGSGTDEEAEVEEPSKESSAYDEVLDFSDFQMLTRQLCGRLRKKCMQFKNFTKGQANLVKAGVANEFQQGWGQTKTARTLGGLKKIDKRQMRRMGKDLGRKAMAKVLGGAGGRKKKLALDKAFASGDDDSFGIHKFIIHNPGDITDFFEIPDFEMKVGGSAKVYRGVEKATHVHRAIKKIYKRDGEYTRLLEEISTMKMLDHPNIVKMFETFEDEKHLYLVLELCEGGDILDRLMDHQMTPLGKFSEFQTAVIIRTMLMTLNYLHINGFVHRDFKPENILCKDKHHDILTSSLRLADFGYARKLPAHEEGTTPPPMTTKVGSPYYVAPEVIRGEYDESCDLWSVGAVCYTLLCGYPPFCGDTDAQTLQLIQDAKYYFHTQAWGDVSKPAKHFVRYLLHKDRGERMDLKQALDHPWVKSRGVKQIERMREETVDRLITFHTHHKLRQTAMLAVAHQMESQDLRGLVELFQGLDLNGDGLLTSMEFRKSIQAICGIEESFISEMMASVDADQSGVIDFSEFVAATLEKEMYYKNHAALLRAFRCFDQDDGGSLTKEEIAETLCMEGEEDQEEVEAFFAEVDLDGDGVMDYGEFYAMLQKETEVTRTAEADEDMVVLGSSEEESEEGAEHEEEWHEEGDEEHHEEAGGDDAGAPKSPKGSPKSGGSPSRSSPKKSKSSSSATSSASSSSSSSSS